MTTPDTRETTPAADVRTAADDRYGVPGTTDVVADERGVIPLMLAHRSVRTFSRTPLDDAVVDTLVAAAQSASTSSNFQSWSVVVVRDGDVKDRAATLAGDQQFIRDAPVFFVFVADWSRGMAIAEREGVTAEGVEYLESTLVASIDAALAAQNAVLAAESLGLGAVYAGAVRNHPQELSALLGLPRGAYPVVGVAVGRPHETTDARVKPRLPQAVVRHDDRYRSAEAAELDAYDETMRAFNASQGRPRGWIDTVLLRVKDRRALKGRDALRDVLTDRGLPSR